VNSGRTVFSQLIQHLPEKEFQKCVARYNGDSNFRGFSCWDQLLAMAFAQLTYRESLRDIESCLRALQSKLYHMGFRGKVSRSTLADAIHPRINKGTYVAYWSLEALCCHACCGCIPAHIGGWLV